MATTEIKITKDHAEALQTLLRNPGYLKEPMALFDACEAMGVVKKATEPLKTGDDSIAITLTTDQFQALKTLLGSAITAGHLGGGEGLPDLLLTFDLVKRRKE